MPKKIQNFAKSALVKPVVVNVGRAGAANLDVIQEVEYVKQEAKIVYLLECLQKSPPPVLIFAEKKEDVDDIHEYLLLKGVEAVAIHGGKDQEERDYAIQMFKASKKDVLVATDVASKGLDFPDIQHVINFDMPKEIENYVHRIGRTGRCGKTGVATTFINKTVPETTLLDLKHLLVEAKQVRPDSMKPDLLLSFRFLFHSDPPRRAAYGAAPARPAAQRVPPVLAAMEDPSDAFRDVGGVKGCAFCGGLGHRITMCPKLEQQKMKSITAGGPGYHADERTTFGNDW
eukprot:tig00021012_g17012.t1